MIELIYIYIYIDFMRVIKTNDSTKKTYFIHVRILKYEGLSVSILVDHEDKRLRKKAG